MVSMALLVLQVLKENKAKLVRMVIPAALVLLVLLAVPDLKVLKANKDPPVTLVAPAPLDQLALLDHKAKPVRLDLLAQLALLVLQDQWSAMPLQHAITEYKSKAMAARRN